RCAKERTNAILSATRAIRGKTPPISTPGTLVWTAPTTLRNSAGADILGSNVSTCEGPPPSQSQTTEVLRVGRPWADASARARSRAGRVSPVAPRTPTLRKSLRVAPSQSARLRDPHRLSMVNPPLCRATLLRTPGGWVGGLQQEAAPPLVGTNTNSSVSRVREGVNLKARPTPPARRRAPPRRRAVQGPFSAAWRRRAREARASSVRRAPCQPPANCSSTRRADGVPTRSRAS